MADTLHFSILHRTYYNFSDSVWLEAHALRLRPLENYEQSIESFDLRIEPAATLRWHLDVERNAVAVATFSTPTRQLAIECAVRVGRCGTSPYDFLVEDHALYYPFEYRIEEARSLAQYRQPEAGGVERVALYDFLDSLSVSGARQQSFTLLQELNRLIRQSLSYRWRDEAGVQSAAETLRRGCGSCRDFAILFIEAARCLGFAARFVSGYVRAPAAAGNFGATHAWAEAYIPGAGWKGFDATTGELAGAGHIGVAVARVAEAVPPVAGTFHGSATSELDVGVWVYETDP